MKYIEVSGSPFAMGRQIGSLYKDVLRRKAAKAERKWMDEAMREKIAVLIGKIGKSFPEALEELKGRAEGAGIALDTSVLLSSPELTRKADGCTTLMMKDAQGKTVFSHNEDERDFYQNNSLLVKYDYGDHWTAAYGCAENLTGFCFGFNSYGMIFSSNYLFPDHEDPTRISRYIYERSLITAKDIPDVRRKLEQMKPASPFSFNAVDTKTDEAFNFEKDLEAVYETEVLDRYARSNHFLAKEGEVRSSPNSLFRAAKARELVNALDPEGLQKEELRDVLDYKEEDIDRSIRLCGARRHSLTVANLSYSNADRSLVIRDYLGRREYRFLFDPRETFALPGAARL